MVYLDTAATTGLDSDVLHAMEPYFGTEFGNASSVHTYGREARMVVERSRQVVADILGAQAKEIIFTSSASESNNLAIKGVIESLREKFPNQELEIVASPVEHPCVMESLRHVEKLGWAKIVWLSVNQHGKVLPEAVEAAVTAQTVLVSVMYVNNEIGTIMPLQSISSVISRERKRRTNSLPIYLHTDAVQAVQYLDCDVNRLGVDLLSLTGHKLYGPKGSGVLYVRDGVPVTRQIDGGGQEYYKRAGTENVGGIVGMGAALQKYAWNRVDEQLQQSSRLKEIQEYLISEVPTKIEGAQLTGHPTERVPHITSFIFENVDPEALIIALDRDGFAVSSGSACSSGVVRQSHVIEALHLDIPKKSAALRVSTGHQTKMEDIVAFIDSLGKQVTLLREMSI